MLNGGKLTFFAPSFQAVRVLLREKLPARRAIFIFRLKLYIFSLKIYSCKLSLYVFSLKIKFASLVPGFPGTDGGLETDAWTCWGAWRGCRVRAFGGWRLFL